MIPAVFQIIIAVIIVVVLLLVALYQYNKEKFDALRSAGAIRKSVVVFQGIKDLSSSKDEMYETVDDTSGSFRDLVPSVNQASGIEYSYNFWLYMDQDGLTDDASTTAAASATANSALGSMNVSDMVTADLDGGLNPTYVAAGQRHKAPLMLFLRGDKRAYTFKKVCLPGTHSVKTDVLVKNPLVKLEDAGNALTVEFNTVDAPDSCTAATDAVSASNPDWATGNAHKVGIIGLRTDNLKKKWFMVTVVVAETAPSLPMSTRNRTTCMIYINGTIAQTQSVAGSSVRNPTGNLYVHPIIKNAASTAVSLDIDSGLYAGKMQMADLTYFNYAITTGELASIFSTGPSRMSAVPATSSTQATAFGTVVNDISSTTQSTYTAIGNQ